MQNFDFDVKKDQYRHGCHSEVEVSEENVWNAQQIYKRGMKMLCFMAERWDFKFDSREQMEDLLHIKFIAENKEIPENLSKYIYVGNENINNDVPSLTVNERINILSKKFVEQKELLGKIRIGKCDAKYIRFTTDLMDGIIPESEAPTSGWNTSKYYYYEIYYENSKIVMCLTFSQHLTTDLLEICKKIHSIFPCVEKGRIQKNNKWKHTLLVANEDDTTDSDSDECINGILEKLFDQLMKLERQLVDKLNA